MLDTGYATKDTTQPEIINLKMILLLSGQFFSETNLSFFTSAWWDCNVDPKVKTLKIW